MLGFQKTTLLLVLAVNGGTDKNLFANAKDFLYLSFVSFKFRFARFKRHFSSAAHSLVLSN